MKFGPEEASNTPKGGAPASPAKAAPAAGAIPDRDDRAAIGAKDSPRIPDIISAMPATRPQRMQAELRAAMRQNRKPRLSASSPRSRSAAESPCGEPRHARGRTAAGKRPPPDTKRAPADLRPRSPAGVRSGKAGKNRSPCASFPLLRKGTEMPGSILYYGFIFLYLQKAIVPIQAPPAEVSSPPRVSSAETPRYNRLKRG